MKAFKYTALFKQPKVYFFGNTFVSFLKTQSEKKICSFVFKNFSLNRKFNPFEQEEKKKECSVQSNCILKGWALLEKKGDFFSSENVIFNPKTTKVNVGRYTLVFVGKQTAPLEMNATEKHCK